MCFCCLASELSGAAANISDGFVCICLIRRQSWDAVPRPGSVFRKHQPRSGEREDVLGPPSLPPPPAASSLSLAPSGDENDWESGVCSQIAWVQCQLGHFLHVSSWVSCFYAFVLLLSGKWDMLAPPRVLVTMTQDDPCTGPGT